MGDENQYCAGRPGWYRDNSGILRIGDKPKPFTGRTPWARRTERARQEDAEFIKTLRSPFLEIYCRGIGTTPEEIRAWEAILYPGD